MRKRGLLKTHEIPWNENVDIIKYIKDIPKSQKKLVFIASTLAISFLLFICFISLYYFSGPRTDVTTISIYGMVFTGTIFVFSIAAGLISFGTYCAYFVINMNKKEVCVAETMAEMSLLIRILERVNSDAPRITESVLVQKDIANELKKFPALKERIAITNESSSFT